jgi:tRNA(Phe) wybutosine-synthesizing methylase Tyw3
MDTQVIFNIAVSCAGGLALWVLNEMTRKLQRLEDRIDEAQRNFVSKDDYRNDIREIKDILSKIFDKLDNKADK